MSKITCELCGTIYEDTLPACPTCATEKPAAVEFSVPEADAPRKPYVPTKGGRFSQSNVKKRLANKGVAPAPVPAKPVKEKPQEQKPRQQKPAKRPAPAPAPAPAGKDKPHIGLVITAILLVIAIIAMLIYMYVEFLMPTKPGPEQENPTGSTPAQSQTDPSTQPPDLSCKELKLSHTAVTLTEVGSSILLDVTTTPADTVDAITFLSSDTAVATVSADGNITAVAPGQAVITVICGSLTAECQVSCDIVIPTTEPTTVPTEPTEAPFKLNREDITFRSSGESWLLYEGDIPLTDIVWTSSNNEVATIRNGRVKAVGKGQCTVYGEYNGQKVSCVIRCSF